MLTIRSYIANPQPPEGSARCDALWHDWFQSHCAVKESATHSFGRSVAMHPTWNCIYSGSSIGATYYDSWLWQFRRGGFLEYCSHVEWSSDATRRCALIAELLGPWLDEPIGGCCTVLSLEYGDNDCPTRMWQLWSLLIVRITLASTANSVWAL